jgi:hypothetical protein
MHLSMQPSVMLFLCAYQAIKQQKHCDIEKVETFREKHVSICFVTMLMSTYSGHPVPPKKCFQLTIRDKFSGSLVIHSLCFYKCAIRIMLNHVHPTLIHLSWE